MPSSDANTPIARASVATLTSTWRRDAPRARTMANSRRRCATVIEKALKMMKAPTSTAMPPKDSSAGLRNVPIASLICLVWSAAACAPVLTSAPGGTTARTRPASVSGETPATPLTSISETCPGRSNHCCASGRVVSMMSEPPSDDCAANVNTPETVTVREPVWVITWSFEPTPRFWSLASFSMMPTSPERAGGAPCTNVLGCSCSMPGE